MPQKVRLKLFGNTYELKGDDPEVDLQEVASFIEEKAGDLERQHSKLPPSKLMVLIAMSLGRELFLVKKQLESLEKTLNLKLKQLSKKIDSHIVEKID